MQRTLIAVFDNRGDAQSAIEELVLSGFSRQQIRLSEGDPTGASSAITGAPGTEPATGAGSIVDSIRSFLGNLFGTDNSEHVQKYSDAVTRGHHVLTLTVDDQPAVERAADIVERYGPVDIDEKAAEWSGGPMAGAAMRMGAGAQQQSGAMSQQSAQGGQATMQGGAQGGSQQRAATLDDNRAVPVAQRPGVKVVEHLAEPALGSFAEIAVADEMYFRGHYNSNYAGAGEHFEDYAPAYQYGWSMASDEQYRGKLWKDVEPALRSDWEGRNPGSAWSKFKAAIHHGWQRITS